ncbi:MAG: ribose-5-phosphate isomerase RpiA [Candidatus Oxydemutatoraceae bacterium WSBS_2016_MAG_OTU14]
MSNSLKQNTAVAALEYIKDGDIVGVGSGSTVDFFIQALAKIKHRIDGTVASSQATQKKLEALHIPVIPSNEIVTMPIYVDGADEIDPKLRMIKGGGAALTGEKIISSLARQFICIADQSKWVDQLGNFPLPIEVLDLAQSFIARKLNALGAESCLRMEQNKIVRTDYGNPILDVRGLDMSNPCVLEKELSLWPGVITVGLFCCRPADTLLLGYDNEVKIISSISDKGKNNSD